MTSLIALFALSLLARAEEGPATPATPATAQADATTTSTAGDASTPSPAQPGAATTDSDAPPAGAPVEPAAAAAPEASAPPATAPTEPAATEAPAASTPPASAGTTAAPSEPAPPPPVLSPEQLKASAVDVPAPELQTVQLTAAHEKTEFLSAKWLRKLKPSPYHLPQNPRGQVDFTAYTLEFGEVKLGLANITVGLLPHVQVGTSVPLDVLGIPNVTAKVHATEGGRFDIAAYGNYYVLPRENVKASYLGVGGITSFQLAEPWSLHLGGGYTRLQSEGNLDFATVGSLISGQDIDEGELVADLGVKGEAASVRLATDVRLNRRDSIVLQVESIVWGKSSTSVPDAVVDFLNLDEALSHDGAVPLGEALTASLSWHFAWKHLEARIGVGWSSAPGAWLLQAAELSYRFGGKTRIAEKQLRNSWKENKKGNQDFKQQLEGQEEAPAPAAP